VDRRARRPEHAGDVAVRERVATSGIRTGAEAVDEVLDEVRCVYVAVDADALDATEVAPFMPEPGGIALRDAERLLAHVAARGTILGAGFSGLAPDERNVPPLTRLATTLGL
jgi:arginase family enzyme